MRVATDPPRTGGCEAPLAAMEPPWLQRLDRPCRLLLHALCGRSGPLAALRLLQRAQALQGPGPAFSWQRLIAALCAEEPALEGPEQALAVKPRLLLLPVVCQRNLFSLLLAVQAVVPGSCLARLLGAVERDSHGDPWVRALGSLLRRGPQGEPCSPPRLPLSAACQQQLRCLCRGIARNKPEGQRKLNWCFSRQPSATGDVANSALQGGKRKKVLEGSLEMDEGRVGKRPLLEEAACDPPGTQESGDVPGVEEEGPGETLGDRSARSPSGAAQGSSQQDAASGPGKVSQVELSAELQSFLQVHGPRLKMLLQKESNHPALSVPPELRVLNSCSPGQLSTCPEHLLLRFCSWLLALSPELSYTSAAVLAEQLFLGRVRSLTHPPSRHLMAALVSFCSKYYQPFCGVVVAAVLRQPGEGAVGCGDAAEGLRAAPSGRGAPAAVLSPGGAFITQNVVLVVSGQVELGLWVGLQMRGRGGQAGSSIASPKGQLLFLRELEGSWQLLTLGPKLPQEGPVGVRGILHGSLPQQHPLFLGLVLIKLLLWVGKEAGLSATAEGGTLWFLGVLSGVYPCVKGCQEGSDMSLWTGQSGGSAPFCFALAGAEQTKLVCELVEECLAPDCVRLLLGQVLEVPLSEKLLPVVQAVLGRQEELPLELFDLLVLTLCRQAPAFTTSLNYAKLLMAVLTTYQSQVTPAHRSRLTAALGCSNAALKKSLQAVLEGGR
ncbi:Fanconi anemia group E protein isoform X2 [Columba livia]|uniref:Fanconi anemia group E protein isoform X2 n=1 Tax=Columba livia TaxID=8932 RepID=UPI0031BB86D6